jgi:hypothetical protein
MAVIFYKRPKGKNRGRGVNSPNLVTLPVSQGLALETKLCS